MADYSSIKVSAEPSGFGAVITGLDLSRPLPAQTLAEVKDAFARHGVVNFPDQPLTLEQLEAFTLQIGPFGVDPYVKPMEGHPNVLELRREPDEKATNFGAGWHSDWSFQPEPPAATLLHGKVIPPVGGDTLYADCRRAYEALSDGFKAMLALTPYTAGRVTISPRLKNCKGWVCMGFMGGSWSVRVNRVATLDHTP